MNHSLLSRFRGALLCGMLGDAVTTQSQLTSVSPDNLPPNWYKILNYQPSEWQRKLQQICLMLEQSSSFAPQAWQQNSWGSGAWAYIVLPIILFHHENEHLLRQEIAKMARLWQWSTEVLEDVLIWGYIVALVVKGKLSPQNIMRQLLVGVRAEQNSLLNKLRRLESWLWNEPCWEQVMEQLSSHTQEWSIPLSIYCFSSTPEDIYLAMNRATYAQNQAKITAMLTGALVGGYNGIMGIPVVWQTLSAQNLWYQKLDRQGKTLFHNWSGVYPRGQQLNEVRIEQRAIAAPGTIQTRSSLIVISQQE